VNLNWIYIAISWILLRWHDFWDSLLHVGQGLGWVLSIVFLVLTVRAILFPVFVKQIKSQRAMQTLQPQVKALQAKHKGDRETLQREMMELYRKEKANPLMGCLPIFLQIPVFIGLFHVLRLIDPTKDSAREAMTSEYGWNVAQFVSAANAKIFGAPIAASLRDNPARLEALGASSGIAVKVVAIFLIITMVVTTYVTQRQMIARSGPAADPQQAMIQKLMLYGVPASLLISGTLFPIGVVIYWVTTNLFSMGQQFYVLRKMPPPGGVQAQKDVERSAAEVKVLAPKPGAKPQNSKKGVRQNEQATPLESVNADKKAATGSKESAAGMGGPAVRRRPGDTRSRKRKGGRR
jgi:YidC/Oxa1 family membrane protein insertase